MIVVDTNVIAYLLLPSSHTDSSENLYRCNPNWVAPALWKSEFRNVLALYLRKNILTLEKALQIQEQAESLLAQNEFEVPSPQVLALVNDCNCSAYDCEFIALAHHLNTRLITQDKQLLNTFSNTAITIADYLAGR